MKLTAKQAAQEAGVSVSMIYQWCHSLRLVHYRLSGRGKRGKILIDSEDLKVLLESQKINEDHHEAAPFAFKHLTLN